jgi:hypothetical protein
MSTTKRERKFIRIKREPFTPGYEMTERGAKFTGKVPDEFDLQDALDDWAEDYDGSSDLFI